MPAQDFDLRSRYLDVDDRLVELKTLMEEASFAEADFREKFDMSWVYHDCGLEGMVLSYHEIKAAIDRKVVSDNHLIPTYTLIKNLKTAMDYIRTSGWVPPFGADISGYRDDMNRAIHFLQPTSVMMLCCQVTHITDKSGRCRTLCVSRIPSA